MRKVLLFAVLFVISISSQSQNLSYTCPRDTVLGCGINCFDLKVSIPDLRGLADDYTLENVSTAVKCYPLAPPSLPGPSTNLTQDDFYSDVINLPFTFKFYGTNYNSLVVSPNGMISFDVSLANKFAHYDNEGDLPNPDYDGAAIMGAYIDLEPTYTTSPDRQTKYNVYGTAPNRKWVLSYYKMPLWEGDNAGCIGMIQNTMQITLHEGTSVVEVTIFDKEICFDSNNGRSMIGMQNLAKTKAIMAPKRRMTDPPWGSIGMNETWRFSPKSGNHLYRSMQLLNGSGAVIATGDTSRIDANNLGWTFNNVCPPTDGPNVYVVKTTYAQLNDPAQTFYSLDTVYVTRNAFPVSATSTGTTCGASTGSITVTQTGGTAPYTYTLDTGTPQASNVFPNLPAGTYTVKVTDNGTCSNTTTVIVSTTSSLSGTATSTNVSCPGLTDGSITVTPTSGTAPYTYSANGQVPPQNSNVFNGLAPGPYTIVFTDVNGCQGSVVRTLTQGQPIDGGTSSTPASCASASNGTITAFGFGGVGPYTFSIDGLAFQVSGTFSGLSAGPHTIIIMDSRGCTKTITRNVTAGSGLTATVAVTAASCTGSSNGSMTVTPTNGTAPYSFSIDGNAPQPTGVFPNLAPGPHTVTFADANTCTGSVTRTITSGAGITGNGVSTPTSCPGRNDGTITITPTSGTAPYTYSIDGTAAQAGNVFPGVSAGPHTITIRDINNCTGTVAVTVTAGAAPNGTATTTPTSCPTRNDGSITVIPGGTGPYVFTLNPGNIVRTTPTFPNLAAGTYSITYTTGNGCAGSVPINPVVAAGPYLSSTVTSVHQPVCANINDGSVTIVPAGTAPYSFTVIGVGTQPTPTFNNLAPGNYTYNFTDAAGCTGTGTFVLSSNPALRTPSVKVMPLCNGNANGRITFNTGGGVAPYQYALSPFTTFQTSNIFNGLVAGSYLFRIKDAVGCSKDTTVVLAEPTVLTASAANTLAATCFGNDGKITVTAGGGTTPYTYSTNNGGLYQTSNVFIAPDTGLYPAIIVKDTKGCTARTSATVALNDTMRLELGASSTICVGSTITLQPQTNAATNIFTWTAQGQPVSTLNDPGIKNPVATPVDTVTYTLSAQWGVCKRQDAVTINVLHKPIVSAGLDTAICNPATQTIPAVATLNGSARDTSGTVNYLWTPSGKVSFPNQAVTPAKTDSTQQFVLTVTDNYGCNFTVTDTVTVFVQPPVQAFAGNDTIGMYNRPHQLKATGGTGYLWKPAGPLNDPTLPNPLATLTADTRFTVIVTDIAGCEGYDTVFIKVYEGPTYYVPNAFTPNGDGRNDIFRAVPAGIASTEYFRVFNRFGDLMFETNQWLKGWDGTFRGKPQPTGTYVWMIKGKDQSGRVIEQKGTVIILR